MENAPTLTVQLFVPKYVLAIHRMLSAVGFDHEPRLRAGEIDDVGRDRVLPPKTPPELLVAKTAP